MNIMKFLKGLLIFIIVVLVLFVFFNKKQIEERALESGGIKVVEIGGAMVNVEVANTQLAQVVGLGGRTTLAENQGMLFVFDVPSKQQFWMKDMQFPIDIIWMNDSRQVIHIEKNVTPDTYPETFGPEMDSKYVLETKAGFVDKLGLKLGDTAEFGY